MTWMLDRVGRHIAAYLQKPAAGYEPFTPPAPAALRATVKPGDILLIEGRTHIAGVIKYLTQSTWSHAALYVGPVDGQTSAEGEPCDLVELNLEAGIISVPLSTYCAFHTRICRPVGLSPEDRRAVCEYAVDRIRAAIRSQEHHRSRPLSGALAGAAALAPPHDRAGFG